MAGAGVAAALGPRLSFYGLVHALIRQVANHTIGVALQSFLPICVRGFKHNDIGEAVQLVVIRSIA